MYEEITTTEYTESPGSDDSIHPSSTTSSISLTDEMKREIVADLLAQGFKGPAIVTILQDDYGLEISLRTLSRLRQSWGLRCMDLPPPEVVPAPKPEIRASLISAHKNGLTVSEMCSQLQMDTGIEPSAKATRVAIRKAARQPNGCCDGHHQPNGPSDGHRNDPMAVRADGPSEQQLGCSTARCAQWPLRAAIGWHNPMAA
ncbi:hypothetical protein PCANC_03180 [Puccinia coronata f. sp. avenae]|uniref:Clr5 domain-containing protein n=1 Tax=Puccinia coronata f. sp. avenae TaxID=200324 RepID=A0A2N5T827_9BASI|nr:hypothetical protein PCANC_03180 [Puccinia coronata f. sp. avenae]